MDNILYIDDEKSNLDVLKVCFYEEFNIYTASSAKEAYPILKENEIKVVITDQRMPNETGIDFINRIYSDFSDVVFMILSGFADFDVALKAIANGRIYRFMLKPWKEDEIRIDINNAIEKYNFSILNKNLQVNLKKQNVELKKLKQRLEDENIYLKEEIKHNNNFENILSNDENFLNILNRIEQIAESDASALITGETGTGKELIARAIHNLSNRRQSPFICVNCAAIPEALFESELFGHEKGAFTGAVNQRKGKFELAHEGTLFLDEIGEIPALLQPKLLRAIQENEIERLGGNKTIKLNIRIISATNRNLEKEIKSENFRSDLFYRLNVFPIVLPPLRERKNDIILLVNFFIEKYNLKYGKKIKTVTKKAVDSLKLYTWPGNVRELENIVERAVIISNSEKLNIENMLPEFDLKEDSKIEKMIDIEKEHILKILDKTSWKIGGDSGAANLLGLNRTTLIARMKKLNITNTN